MDKNLESLEKRVELSKLFDFYGSLLKEGQREIFEDYCAFLFNVLDQTRKKLGDVDRLYGFLGELLLDVYLTRNKLSYQELAILHTEPIDWTKKIIAFIKRKYGTRK